MSGSVTRLLGCLGLSPGCWDVWEFHPVAGMSGTVDQMPGCLGLSPGCRDVWDCHLDARMSGSVTGCWDVWDCHLDAFSSCHWPRAPEWLWEILPKEWRGVREWEADFLFLPHVALQNLSNLEVPKLEKVLLESLQHLGPVLKKSAHGSSPSSGALLRTRV